MLEISGSWVEYFGQTWSLHDQNKIDIPPHTHQWRSQDVGMGGAKTI